MSLVSLNWLHICIVLFTLQMRMKKKVIVKKKSLSHQLNMSMVLKMITKVNLWNLVPLLLLFNLKKSKKKIHLTNLLLALVVDCPCASGHCLLLVNRVVNVSPGRQRIRKQPIPVNVEHEFLAVMTNEQN